MVARHQCGQQPPLYLAGAGMLYPTGHSRRRKQLWDCSQLHLPCRWVKSIAKCRERMRGIKRSSSRSSGKRCDSSLCTVRNSFARPIYPWNRRAMQQQAPRKPEGVSRTAITPSAVCTPANVDTRIRSPRCPSPASSRLCISRAAACGIPRAIPGVGSSFGTAASCICRVVGVNPLPNAGSG